jgi:multidrug efflux pump subunit AcrA (membrane-fusion protein)
MTQRTLLKDQTRRRDLVDLTGKLETARRTLEQAKQELVAKTAQFESAYRTAVAVYDQQRLKYLDIVGQIKECSIHAPQDGMVVYYKNESSRFSSTQQGLIEQGAQVKEGQKMLRIPNLEKMQVNTKIHEATVGRVKGDVRVPTGMFDGMKVGLMLNPDPFGRLIGETDEALEKVREKYRDHEYRIASFGQRATVRVDAMPDRLLKGRVRSVAQVASQTDSWISDVKLFPTLVLIEEVVEGLKPDGTAEVTIHVDAAKEPVLAVPLQAVIGGAELGAKREVFVKTADGYAKRDITLGLYNDKMVEVKDGLNDGDEVVINPKVLLGDAKAKTRDGNGTGGGDEKGGKAGGKTGEKGDGKKGPGGGGKRGGGKGPGGPAN